jgi:RNA polymerase sigma-70 factor (ECF subfamily)
MISEQDLVSTCKEFNPAGQRLLYYQYAPKMKAVCLRYSSNPEEAKDILQESFIKVFSKIHSFSNKGSLEGWIKRIVINTAIDYFKKNKKYMYENIETYIDSDILNKKEHDILEINLNEGSDQASVFDFSEKELMNAINVLPEPFRLVFNLFYMEDHSHKNIAELLSIEENTSKTRLFRAKKLLQKHLSGLRKSSLKEVLKKV